MKIKLLFGIALALMLCISPVAAVSGDDFEIVKEKDGKGYTYRYHNVTDPNVEYFHIITYGTDWLNSLVIFKPANIPDAPEMVVNTFGVYRQDIYLTQSVDEWEIKYYSRFGSLSDLDDKYLKNKGVVNMKKEFNEYLQITLYLELSTGQYIFPLGHNTSTDRWHIPDVD